MWYIAKYYGNSFSAPINSYDLLYFHFKGKVIGIYCTLKQEVELEDTVKNEFEHFRPVVDQEMYL